MEADKIQTMTTGKEEDESFQRWQYTHYSDLPKDQHVFFPEMFLGESETLDTLSTWSVCLKYLLPSFVNPCDPFMKASQGQGQKLSRFKE